MFLLLLSFILNIFVELYCTYKLMFYRSPKNLTFPMANRNSKKAPVTGAPGASVWCASAHVAAGWQRAPGIRRPLVATAFRFCLFVVIFRGLGFCMVLVVFVFLPDSGCDFVSLPHSGFCFWHVVCCFSCLLCSPDLCDLLCWFLEFLFVWTPVFCFRFALVWFPACCFVCFGYILRCWCLWCFRQGCLIDSWQRRPKDTTGVGLCDKTTSRAVLWNRLCSHSTSR